MVEIDPVRGGEQDDPPPQPHGLLLLMGPEVGPHEGYLLESLMAAVASSSEDAQARMREFLEGRAARVAAPAEAGT